MSKLSPQPDFSPKELNATASTPGSETPRGVIEFDLAMLEAADVPTLVHDSIMFKNIENQAIAGLAQAYLNASKQTFVAIDKLSSYPEIAQRALSDAVVLSLGPDGEALFGRTWRKTEQQSSLDAQA
ncbi:MAG: DUF2326 domain-containing protein [Atopobiaceae bacterium]|nr:DUF2326 domain-containing protein [Atopobiaceae bacterium]